MQNPHPVITVDGPSGTGKGTIAQLLSKKLGWNYLDSGALYRVLALAAVQHRVELDNEPGLEVLARHLDVQFNATELGVPPRITLEGQEVTEKIRTQECGSNASIISAFPSVRHALLERQRAFCQAPGLVTDGRDMGTVVFPEAQLKIYLDATQEARTERRLNQLKIKGISTSDRKHILAELIERDKRDTQRKVAPLRKAPDAIHIDTSEMSIDEVLERVYNEAKGVK